MDTDTLPTTTAAHLPATAGPLPAGQNPARVYVASLPSPQSRRAARAGLKVVAGILTDGATDALPANQVLDAIPWHAMRYQHVAAIKAALMQRGRPATTNQRLSVLRRVMRHAYLLGHVDADVLQRVQMVENVKAQTLPAGRVPKMAEFQRLFDVCKADETPAGARDAALIAVLLGAGLRRAEAVRLQMANYDTDSGDLDVEGKGRQERIVPLTNGTADAVAAWLRTRGDEPGPLFLRVSQTGQIEAEGITAQAAWNALQKRIRQAGLKDMTPHDLRRAFATYLLEAGADVFSVQKLMGHARPETTLRYDRRGEDAKRKAAQLLTIPY